jgi:hypothetical protein
MSNQPINFTNDGDLGHTGRFNSLGDELVVFAGYSDHGHRGWFTGRRVIDTRDPDEIFEMNTPMIFFQGEEKGKGRAIADLDSGFYDKFEARIDLRKFRL